MLAGIRKRLARRHLDIKDCEDDDKGELHSTFVPPPNYIRISQGKIQLVEQTKVMENDVAEVLHKPVKEVLESRIVELERALQQLQEKVNHSQCGSPTFEKELRDQLQNMQRVMKSKNRKTMQTCRDHKVLQTRFTRQESKLQALQMENHNLIMRIRQYEHCLDDVMRKVVDAIVAEDNLREEVAMLKTRVRDLEEQNAVLSSSPAKGRDEGYCTMSSGQPQPSNSHLEDLPEEPEQWLLPAEPCATEMEDWSMSQEELAVIALDDHHMQERHQQLQQQTRNNGDHDWIWNSSDFLNSTVVETDSVSDGISQLLQQKIVYSEDEEIACIEFTNDFYKLVNIRGSGSSRSLYSYIEGQTDDEDDDSSLTNESNTHLHRRTALYGQHVRSPTPSEAGRDQVTSCSSSESDEMSRFNTLQKSCQSQLKVSEAKLKTESDIVIREAETSIEAQPAMIEKQNIEDSFKVDLRRHPLIKSKEEQEPSCILRNNRRREIEPSVVRSGSASAAITVTETAGTKGWQQSTNSWRKSNGWKRVTSPVRAAMGNVSPKKETKSEVSRSFQLPQKAPTRIPTSIQQPQSQQTQQQPIRKSKIPPPVPVRRSYAS